MLALTRLSDSSGGCGVGCAVRLFSRFVRAGHRSGAVSYRQWIFLSKCTSQVAANQNQQRVQHRLSWIWWPQGVLAAERIIEEIAYHLGKDPLEIRKRNFYGEFPRNITPYHQTVEDNILPRLVSELEQTSDYQTRRQAVLAHNAQDSNTRKGIALTPVKFGISFTATWFNQAGALIHIYNDGVDPA